MANVWIITDEYDDILEVCDSAETALFSIEDEVRDCYSVGFHKDCESDFLIGVDDEVEEALANMRTDCESDKDEFEYNDGTYHYYAERHHVTTSRTFGEATNTNSTTPSKDSFFGKLI